MKKNIFISLLIGMMGVIAFMGCETTGATFKPNDELFEYTCYDKGSYWVYEDSATHEIDSIAVITEPIKEKTHDFPCNGTGSWVKTFKQKYNYVNTTKFINDTFTYMPTIHGDFRFVNDSRYGYGDLLPADCYYSPNVETLYKIENKRIAYSLPYINTPNPSEYVYYHCLPWYIMFYSSYYVGNKKYNNVKKFTYKNYSHYPTDSIVAYWAKNIGVIRWECHDTIGSTIMNLVRYDAKNLKEKELYKR